MDNNNGNYNNIDIYTNQSGGNVYPMLPPDQNIPSQPQFQTSIPTAPTQQPSQPQLQQQSQIQPQIQIPVQPQQLQSSPQQVQIPIQVPVQPPYQYYSQNSALASPSNPPPNYNDIVNDPVLLEEKFHSQSANPNETEAVVDNDPYAM